MRVEGQHLSAEEIELLGKEEGLSGELGEQLRSAREHADACPACRRRLEVYPTTGAKLERLRAPQGAQKGPDCPSIDIWLKLAGGLLNTAEQERYTAHAAQCDYCGPVLREVLEDFSEPATEEEKRGLATLGEPVQPWRQATTARIAPSPSVLSNRLWLGFPRWQPAAVGLAICVGIGFALFRFGVFENRDTATSVNQLLARAYTEKRSIEMRIPGAHYAPVQVTLGAGGSHFNRPATLLDAEAKLQRQLESSPDDPNWLDAKGRAELLDGDFDAAVGTLERASRASPESASFLIDLATAYFERGAKSNASDDYGRATDLLGKVLQKSPNEPIALFNRALANERQMLFPQAATDWESYLRVDPNGGWADEARSHLQKLQEKILEHKNSVLLPQTDPEAFIRLAESHNPDVINRINERIEDYQDVAIQQWLPMLAGSDQGSNRNLNLAAIALQDLAALLAEHHGDQWLGDLLVQPRSQSFASGLFHLRDAVTASASGDPSKALVEAEVARRDFISSSNQAAELRAAMEGVHALRRAQKGEDCLEKADRLSQSVHRYPWLWGQLSVDQSSCALMLGEFDLAEAYVLLSDRLAEQHSYRTLQLRSLGLAASVRSNQGDISAAWAEDQSGLEKYWTGDWVSPMRPQQFYDDLSYLAESLEEWHSALAFAEESARMLALTDDREAEALSRQHLAKIAVHTGNLTLAADELSKSSSLLGHMLSTSQTGEGTKADRLYSEIALGEIEIEMGKREDAQARLSSIAPEIEATKLSTHFTIPQQFYAVYARLLLKQHREPEAEDALLSGIDTFDTYSQRILSPSERYFWSQENSDLYRSLIYLELLKGDNEKAFSAWEWYKSGPLGRSHGGAKSLREFWGNEGVRSLLSGLVNQTVISYTLLPQGLAIWVADDHGVEGHLSELDTQQLTDWITEFYALCSDKRSDIEVVKRRGRRLFDLLVAPVAQVLDPHRLVIIEPDGVMGDLPFQALTTPENRYFGQSYQVSLSAGLLYNDSRIAAPILSSTPALIVGSTANLANGDISLLPAPDVLDQADEIAGKFVDARKLKGAEATTQAMESALKKSAVFHFVGHAVSSREQEGLLLFTASPDAPRGAVLWTAERINPKLLKRLRLVVLAACSTGRAYRGRVGKHGELVHNLLLGGVPNVVASHWDVEAKATRSLMAAFYSALLSGRSVPEALQHAEAGLRANPPTQHPFFWAAFAAFGQG